MIIFFIMIVCAYLVGSIPIGYVVAKIKGISDIRKHGSGNIGATNVSRLLGIRYFFIIFLLDAGKAYVFINYAASFVSAEQLYFVAAVLLIGNCYSIFLNGTGGKGISTIFGIIFAIQPVIALIIFAMWSGNFICTRNAGISSVISICSLLGLATIYGDVIFIFWSFFAVCLTVWTHRANLLSYCCTSYL